MNTIERLQQEHAVYKQFFNDIRKPKNANVDFSEHWKARAFEVLERIEKINKGEYYWKADWVNAENILFPLPSEDPAPYRYLNHTDQDIEYLVINTRKLSLRRDLERHLKMILRVWFKAGSRLKYRDLSDLFEWSARLLRILAKKKSDEQGEKA